MNKRNKICLHFPGRKFGLANRACQMGHQNGIRNIGITALRTFLAVKSKDGGRVPTTTALMTLIAVALSANVAEPKHKHSQLRIEIWIEYRHLLLWVYPVLYQLNGQIFDRFIDSISRSRSFPPTQHF